MSEFSPPAGARSAARRGLDLVKAGKAGGGFEPATAARARKIVAGDPLTRAGVMRMRSFFSRHAVDRKPNWGAPGKETPGYVSWQTWGGNAGASWSSSLANKLRQSAK